MYAISVSAFVSLLALVSSLAVVAQAGNPRPQCTSHFTVVAGVTITCDDLAKTNHLSTDQLKAMNTDKDINCNAALPADTYCVAITALVCAIRVKAKDTSCPDMLSDNNLTQQQFYDYNDDVNTDCSNIKKGNTYCVRTY